MLGGGAGGTMAFGGSGSFHQNDSGSGNENTISDHGFGGGMVDSTRSGGGHSNDGGSGSTMKKTSYKDKIKNFVKKHTSNENTKK